MGGGRPRGGQRWTAQFHHQPAHCTARLHAAVSGEYTLHAAVSGEYKLCTAVSDGYKLHAAVSG